MYIGWHLIFFIRHVKKEKYFIKNKLERASILTNIFKLILQLLFTRKFLLIYKIVIFFYKITAAEREHRD